MIALDANASTIGRDEPETAELLAAGHPLPSRAPSGDLAQRAEESDLARRIAAGDEAALGEVHRRYGGLLLALGQRILGSREAAEDLLQEVLLQVWSQANRYESSRAALSTWLTMILRTRAIDRLRTRKVRTRTVTSMKELGMIPVEAAPEADRDVLELERRRRIRRVLAELPREQRQVLTWAYYGGWTQREISERSGIPLGTVKTRTLLALRKLRKALAEEVRDLRA